MKDDIERLSRIRTTVQGRSGMLCYGAGWRGANWQTISKGQADAIRMVIGMKTQKKTEKDKMETTSRIGRKCFWCKIAWFLHVGALCSLCFICFFAKSVHFTRCCCCFFFVSCSFCQLPVDKNDVETRRIMTTPTRWIEAWLLRVEVEQFERDQVVTYSSFVTIECSRIQCPLE